MKQTKFMNKILKRMSRKVGQSPGTFIHVGEKKTDTFTLNLIRYARETLEEKAVTELDKDPRDPAFKGVCWYNLSGIHDVEKIEKISGYFNLHPLVVEDILNTYHRPKFEDLGDYLFIVIKMLYYDKNENEVKSEHVSLILGADYVLAFQEQEGDVFDPVRERIRSNQGRLRKLGADYLLYALMDAVVDNYFLVLETLGEALAIQEDLLLENPTHEVLQNIHKLKREMIFLRKAVWPLREVIGGLQKSESQWLKKTTAVFLRDIYDHTIQIIETGETFRDMVAGLQDLYLSSMSNRMNEVMKVLTLIATIFIPLTFIAGIYGMNFEYMPELKWKFGYFLIWGIIILIGLAMGIYFKRKKWL